MTSVVLITGASRYPGGRLAGRLAADPGIERIIAVDPTAPRAADLAGFGRVEFVRADIRNPLIAKVIAQARVDVVVHAAPSSGPRGPRTTPADRAVTGTMQLLAACQTSDSVRRVVVKSTAAVYGSSARDPALFTEDTPVTGAVDGGYARDAVEVESYVRGFARRRPDIEVTVLRLANLLGPTIDTALTRYLAMPLVPTALGFDPRLQFLHESDAVEVLRRAALGARPGVLNVAADGVLTLAQVLRRAGRLRLPVPAPALALAGALVRNSGVADVSAEEASFLNFGRALDTTRLRTEFGYRPQYTTAEALASYLAGRPRLPRPVDAVLARAHGLLSGRVDAVPVG